MNFVLISNWNSRANQRICEALAQLPGFAGVLLEPPHTAPPQRLPHWLTNSRFYRRLRYRLAKTPADKLHFFEAELRAQAEAHFQKQLQEKGYGVLPPIPSQLIHRADKLHSTKSENFLRNSQAEVGLVLGTGILKASLFAIPPKGCYNVHTSLLPEYRGAFVEFWQMKRGEPDQVGLTLHQVTDQLDAGGWLIRRAYPKAVHPNPFHVRAHLQAEMPDAFRELLHLLEQGAEPQPYGAEPRTPVFKTKDKTVALSWDYYQAAGLV